MTSTSSTRLKGRIFDIQRFCLDDGPGIRTTVFLKGCPLRCIWCHNPEGIDGRPQVRLIQSLCVRCGRCVSCCPQGGHEVTPEAHLLSLSGCIRCMACVRGCPTGALEMVGRRMTVEEVIDVVRRDVPFYEQSRGGMTLSGGEPLAQIAFTKLLLAAAKAEGIHTALETAAYCSRRAMDEIAPLVDLFLIDLKHTDPARHKALTGVSNRRILSNIRAISDSGRDFVLRVPWAPGLNADEALLNGLRDLVLSLPRKPVVELMPYHRLGISKWASLGLASPIPEDIPAATVDEAGTWIAKLAEAGIQARVSGT